MMFDNILLTYRLIKTNCRITFDIVYQHPDVTYTGPDDGPYYEFRASNGYIVYSRSRMDIHTERIWLLGAKPNSRSGSWVFSSNEKRDRAYDDYTLALKEWAAHNSGIVLQLQTEGDK